MKGIIRNTTVFAGPEFKRTDAVDLSWDDHGILEVAPSISGNAVTEIDGADFFVTPGFVNAHFHPSQQLNRALCVGLSHDGQMDLLHSTEKIKHREDKLWMSYLAVLEALKAGTTSFYSVGSEIETQIRVFRDMGLRAACALIPKDINADEKHDDVRAKFWDTKERLAYAEDLHRKYHKPLVQVCFGVCNVRYASDELICGMLDLACAYDVPFHMHAAESDEYVESVRQRTGRRPVEQLKQLGALSPRVSLAHATKLTREEIAFLAEAGAHVIHCPRANAYAAVGPCPVLELKQAGVNVALGSDAAINNNSNEVRPEAQAAYFLLTNKYKQADLMSCVELFSMLTSNGARAMGLGHEIGTIEPGKKADFVLWSKNDLPFIPGHNLLADLLFVDSCRAHTVVVDGEVVLKKYVAENLDEERIVSIGREIADRYRFSFESLHA
jgi:5-methylthioadenosine/S-adenosylhomocysteine deaminase